MHTTIMDTNRHDESFCSQGIVAHLIDKTLHAGTCARVFADRDTYTHT